MQYKKCKFYQQEPKMFTLNINGLNYSNKRQNDWMDLKNSIICCLQDSF